MNEELIERIEAEILEWPGVEKETRADGIVGSGEVAIYTLGRRHIGHVHHDGVADIQLPRKLHDDLVAAGRAQPHRGGFRAVVSHRIESVEDAAKAVELFRMSYERSQDAAKRKATRNR